MEAVIKTGYGEVRGQVVNGVASLKGSPTPAPPFGSNRMRPSGPTPRNMGRCPRRQRLRADRPQAALTPQPFDELLPGPGWWPVRIA